MMAKHGRCIDVKDSGKVSRGHFGKLPNTKKVVVCETTSMA